MNFHVRKAILFMANTTQERARVSQYGSTSVFTAQKSEAGRSPECGANLLYTASFQMARAEAELHTPGKVGWKESSFETLW